MKTYISQKEWLELPVETRQKLILTFAIHKSEGVVVQNNKVISDGCSQKDLMGLSIDKMIDYLGSEWEKVHNEMLYDDLFARVLVKMFGFLCEEYVNNIYSNGTFKGELTNGKTKEIDPEGTVTAEKGPQESNGTKETSQGNKRGPKKRICGRGGAKTINPSSGDRQPVQSEATTDQSERAETENKR